MEEGVRKEIGERFEDYLHASRVENIKKTKKYLK